MHSHSPIQPRRFAFTSPYGGCPTSRVYEACGGIPVWKQKIKGERQFRDLLSRNTLCPELVIMNNFIVERAGIEALCRELNCDMVHTEDGFLPHYGYIHLDPIGFCWESSLSRMFFRRCTDRQRRIADQARDRLVMKDCDELPSGVKQPFVLWPLQLLGDKVNEHAHRFKEWGTVLKHFRECLPKEIQLVVKPHPRSRSKESLSTDGMRKVIQVPKKWPLPALLNSCAAVAGVNSTVLQEARLLYLKPVYVYGPSWYNNHVDLFMPVDYRYSARQLSRIDDLFNDRIRRSEYLRDYCDWYLYQLLARQYPVPLNRIHDNQSRFMRWAHTLTFDSFLQYGEQIFDDSYIER